MKQKITNGNGAAGRPFDENDVFIERKSTPSVSRRTGNWEQKKKKPVNSHFNFENLQRKKGERKTKKPLKQEISSFTDTRT